MRTQAICLALATVLFCSLASSQWVRTNGLDGEEVVTLAACHAGLFAATVRCEPHCVRRVFSSTDDGLSWMAADSGLSNEETVHAFAAIGTNLFAARGHEGVYLSTNNGQRWVPATALPYDSVGQSYPDAMTLAACGTNLLAGTYCGVFLSTDNGTSWTASGLNEWSVTAFAAIGTNVFAGTYCIYQGEGGCIFRSADNGMHWTPAYVGPIAIHDIASNNTYGFALGWTGSRTVWHLLYSANEESWQEVSIPSFAGNLTTLAMSGTSLFLGGGGGGFPYIELSGDSAGSWAVVDTGLHNTHVDDLVISGINLYAGTWDGVWKRPLSEMITSVGLPLPELPTRFSLDQNYPNPFNPSTTIRYELPKSSVVRLSVYDILGREVSVLVNERKNAGEYEVQFDARNLASGIYFYILQAGLFVETKKLLLVR